MCPPCTSTNAQDGDATDENSRWSCRPVLGGSTGSCSITYTLDETSQIFTLNIGEYTAVPPLYRAVVDCYSSGNSDLQAGWCDGMFDCRRCSSCCSAWVYNATGGDVEVFFSAVRKLTVLGLT